MDIRWWLVVASLACGAVQAQDGKACAVLMLQSAGATLAPLAKKLQPQCATRTGLAVADVARQVKELRQQGYRRVVLVGQGAGANAALGYAGAVGDIDGVLALGGDAAAGDLPALAPKIRQHIALLWVVGQGDALAKRGEDYAFAKAPPHPASRYVEVKGDAPGAPEAAAKTIAEWIKSLD